MKAMIQFYENPVDSGGYCIEDEPMIFATNQSIIEKAEGKFIEIPCLPVKGMMINLVSFAANFGLSDKEIEFLKDGNELMTIADIVIYGNHIVLCCE